MPVYARGYKPWKGKLQPHPFRTLAIAQQALRQAFRGLLPKLFFVLGLFTCIVPIGRIFLLAFFTPQLQADAAEAVRDFITWQFPFAGAMIALCGSALISTDLKHDSLALVFSKAIYKIDYIIGKVSVLIFIVVLFTTVPSLAIVAVAFAKQPDWVPPTYTAHIALGATLHGLLLGAVLSCLIVGFSSLTRHHALAGLGLLAVCWIGYAIPKIAVDLISAKPSWTWEEPEPNLVVQTEVSGQAGLRVTEVRTYRRQPPWNNMEQVERVVTVEELPSAWLFLLSLWHDVENVGNQLYPEKPEPPEGVTLPGQLGAFPPGGGGGPGRPGGANGPGAGADEEEEIDPRLAGGLPISWRYSLAVCIGACALGIGLLLMRIWSQERRA